MFTSWAVLVKLDHFYLFSSRSNNVRTFLRVKFLKFLIHFQNVFFKKSFCFTFFLVIILVFLGINPAARKGV